MIGRATMKNPWIFRQIADRHGGAAARARRRSRSGATSCSPTSRRSRRRPHDPKEALHKLRTMTGWYTSGLPHGRALRVRISELATPGGLPGGRRGVLRRPRRSSPRSLERRSLLGAGAGIPVPAPSGSFLAHEISDPRSGFLAALAAVLVRSSPRFARRRRRPDPAHRADLSTARPASSRSTSRPSTSAWPASRPSSAIRLRAPELSMAAAKRGLTTFTGELQGSFLRRAPTSSSPSSTRSRASSATRTTFGYAFLRSIEPGAYKLKLILAAPGGGRSARPRPTSRCPRSAPSSRRTWLRARPRRCRRPRPSSSRTRPERGRAGGHRS